MTRPTKSLSTRLTTSLLLSIGSVWIAVALTAAWHARSEINEGLDNALVDAGHRLLNLALHDLSLSVPDKALRFAPSKNRVQEGDITFEDDYLIYQVLNSSKQILLRSQDAPSEPLPAPLSNGFTDLPDWRVYTFKHPTEPIYIQVADSAAHREQALMESALRLLLPMLGLLPFIGLLIRWITHRELVPVQQLAEQISQRNSLNLKSISGKFLPAELQIISDSTNHLLARLGDALDTEKALAANAAHELRTPLATTRLRLHTLLDMNLDAAAKIEVNKAIESLIQLSSRAEKLLQLSRAESGASLNSEPVNLAVLTAIVVQEFWANPDLLTRIHLHIPSDHDVIALGDFDALAIVVRNLIENAVRYGGNGNIEVIVEQPAVVRVRDNGPGLADDKLLLIRKRHVKNTQDGAGYGLGMSIISTIVERHAGVLTLNSPPAGQANGFEAVIELQAPHADTVVSG